MPGLAPGALEGQNRRLLLQTGPDAWQVSEDSASTEDSCRFALRQPSSAQPCGSPELQFPESSVPLGSSAFRPWLKLRFLVLCLGWPREEAKPPVLLVQALGRASEARWRHPGHPGRLEVVIKEDFKGPVFLVSWGMGLGFWLTWPGLPSPARSRKSPFLEAC